MSVFKAAAVQMRSGTDIAPQRRGTSRRWCARRPAQGATYVQTPEMTGALVRDKEARASAFTTEDKDLVVAAASRLAGELGIHLHVGSTAILRTDGKIANRALLFGPDGAIVASYDKIHMFDVDLDNGESWRESATYEPGTRAVVADLPLGAARLCRLLRPALPAAVPRRGAGRRRRC